MRPPTRMLSQWGGPWVFSLAFHPHGEHVSPLLDFFVMHPQADALRQGETGENMG